jgi:hypothetical protein
MQSLLQCKGMEKKDAVCSDIFDGKIETKVNFVEGSSITQQFITKRSMDYVRVFYPPTEAAGTRTQMHNLFFFKVQCRVDGAGKEEWITVFDNTQDAKKHPNQRPGTRYYKMKKACSSHTWRMSQIGAHPKSLRPYITVLEIKLITSGSKPVTAKTPFRLPKFGRVQQVVKPQALAITTEFQKIARQFTCLEIETKHLVSGPCSNLRDRDVNSAVVFANRCGGMHCKPGDATPEFIFAPPDAKAAYSSVWYYYNPALHEWLSRRLRTFDFACQRADGTWRTLIKQTNPDKTMNKQFVKAANIRHNTPCTTCWVQFHFDKECASTKFKIFNMNKHDHDQGAHKFHKHVFLFEVVLGQKGVKPDLPPFKPPKIQGYCVDNNNLDITRNVMTKPGLRMNGSLCKAGKKCLSGQDFHLLGKAPCRSTTLAEIDVPKFTQMYGSGGTVDLIDSHCETVTVMGARGLSAGFPRLSYGWRRAKLFHRNTWTQVHNWKKDAYKCAVRLNQKSLDIEGITHAPRGANEKYMWCNCEKPCPGHWPMLRRITQFNSNLGPFRVEQVHIARSPVIQADYTMKSLKNSKTTFEGPWKVVIWYKPPLDDAPCEAEKGVQYEAFGGDAAQKPPAKGPK